MITYRVTYVEHNGEHGKHEGHAIVEAPSRLEAGLAVTEQSQHDGIKRLLTSITRMENA